ncbi:MAG TPA: PepSY domain-containing protein, partial [Ruminiclostridium sp.]|nr:PepSY domain-containing protein [Ruminiclostridium sp.]
MRKAKIIPAIALSLCMLLSQTALAESISVAASSSPAQQESEQQPQTKISKENATSIAKSFDFAKGLEIRYTHLNRGGTEDPVWSFDLYSSQDGGDCSVGISAETGELTEYRHWQQDNRIQIVKFTKEEAQKAAEKFVAKYTKLNIGDLSIEPDRYAFYGKTSGIYQP